MILYIALGWVIIWVLYYVIMYLLLGNGPLLFSTAIVTFILLPYFLFITGSQLVYGFKILVIPSWIRRIKFKFSNTKTYYDPWLQQVITIKK